MEKERVKKGIRIIFMLGPIGLLFIFSYEYVVGLIFGMVIMTYTLLFPNMYMREILDTIFGYSKNTMVVMKNDAEKADKENPYKVSYKDGIRKG